MRETRKGKYAWWGSNVPNNIAAGLDPVVQESKTSVGDKIGEAHVCDRGEYRCMESRECVVVVYDCEEFLRRADCAGKLETAQTRQDLSFTCLHMRPNSVSTSTTTRKKAHNDDADAFPTCLESRCTPIKMLVSMRGCSSRRCGLVVL